MQGTWEQNTKAETDQWDLNIDHKTYCHITQYKGRDDYCAQAVRGDFRLAEIVQGREAAMKFAEETMSLPIEEFNRRVTAELIDDLRKIERQIIQLSPNTHLMPGYHIGFEDGIEHMQNKIAKAIAKHPHQQEVV